MYNFKNDYNAPCAKEILEIIYKNINEKFDVYGLDEHSKNAANLIKKHIHGLDADIHFLVGGTSVNKTFISHVLKPYEAVISATTGHIFVHETGAIEATGHKVLTVPANNGKICPEDIKKIYHAHTDEHMVKPKLVYISEPTETGSVYSSDEIKEIYSLCRYLGMYLYVDGARLSEAIATSKITIDELAHNSDAFYLGGTKNGALLGEALVIINDELKKDFRFSIKQNGGMYSKGYIIGLEYEAFFKDNLYFDLGEKANAMAKVLATGLIKRNINLTAMPETNQIFLRVSNTLYEKLKEIVIFELWEDKEEEKIIRFVTSFATANEEVESFLNDLDKIL